MTDVNACPCKSGKSYADCCGAFISREILAETAEQLMRSRYSAYVKQEIDYLKDTLWPKYQKKFNEIGTLLRAKDSRWLGLEILETGAGQKRDKEGYVLFVAHSVVDGVANKQREKSLFKKKAGRWYYVKALRDDRDS